MKYRSSEPKIEPEAREYIDKKYKKKALEKSISNAFLIVHHNCINYYFR